MLFMKTVAGYSNNHTRNFNTLWGNRTKSLWQVMRCTGLLAYGGIYLEEQKVSNKEGWRSDLFDGAREVHVLIWNNKTVESGDCSLLRRNAMQQADNYERFTRTYSHSLHVQYIRESLGPSTRLHGVTTHSPPWQPHTHAHVSVYHLKANVYRASRGTSEGLHADAGRLNLGQNYTRMGKIYRN